MIPSRLIRPTVGLMPTSPFAVPGLRIEPDVSVPIDLWHAMLKGGHITKEDHFAVVNYSTANGTATAGSDYVSVSGTLTFAPGQTSKTLTVWIVGDKKKEANETFNVRLVGNLGPANIVDGTGVGTIVNDD